MFERYAFVAVTTRDLDRARAFWVGQLGFAVTEEKPGQFFMVDAAGLRLCVDLADGDIHATDGGDPEIGFRVRSVAETIALLRDRGLSPVKGPVTDARGSWAAIRDPDGRAIILTETD
ncbi:MAG TPA: VOC family protein [Candidatus Acidoferrum sp.]|nr:VOC family protein [Candidatus Acidoferrum sp.]